MSRRGQRTRSPSRTASRTLRVRLALTLHLSAGVMGRRDAPGMNAIEHFFDVGAVVKRAVDNPLHALCREAYLGFFRKHKQNFRVTKTEYMGKEQWCSWLAEVILILIPF